MNNLAYSSQDPNVVAPRVAELVAAETKEPARFEVQQGTAAKASLGTLVGDSVKLMLGNKEASTLFVVHFTVTSPRAMTLSVPLDRQGIGCHAGGVTYATTLSKSVTAEVMLGEPGIFSGAKFTGEPTAAAKLNANGALLKRVRGFMRTEGKMGGIDVEIPQLFRIAPQDGGSVVVVNSLPKPLKLGFAMSLEIHELAAIASLLEAALS